MGSLYLTVTVVECLIVKKEIKQNENALEIYYVQQNVKAQESTTN